MKAKIIRITILTIAVVISLNLRLNLKNDLSDISLANVEALANESDPYWVIGFKTGVIEEDGVKKLCCVLSEFLSDACDFGTLGC